MDSWLPWSGIKDTASCIKDASLFLLALYGAALSTFNWRQAVRKERREIKVSLSTIIPAYANGDTGNYFAKIEATNVGHRPVTVTMIALELPTVLACSQKQNTPFQACQTAFFQCHYRTANQLTFRYLTAKLRLRYCTTAYPQGSS